MNENAAPPYISGTERYKVGMRECHLNRISRLKKTFSQHLEFLREVEGRKGPIQRHLNMLIDRKIRAWHDVLVRSKSAKRVDNLLTVIDGMRMAFDPGYDIDVIACTNAYNSTINDAYALCLVQLMDLTGDEVKLRSHLCPTPAQKHNQQFKESPAHLFS